MSPQNMAQGRTPNSGNKDVLIQLQVLYLSIIIIWLQNSHQLGLQAWLKHWWVAWCNDSQQDTMQSLILHFGLWEFCTISTPLEVPIGPWQRSPVGSGPARLATLLAYAAPQLEMGNDATSWIGLLVYLAWFFHQERQSWLSFYRLKSLQNIAPVVSFTLIFQCHCVGESLDVSSQSVGLPFSSAVKL